MAAGICCSYNYYCELMAEAETRIAAELDSYDPLDPETQRLEKLQRARERSRLWRQKQKLKPRKIFADYIPVLRIGQPTWLDFS